MKIGVLPVGEVSLDILSAAGQGLIRIFPDSSFKVINEPLPVPMQAFDKQRGQHNSSIILSVLRSTASLHMGLHRVLGVLDADIYASGLNYVFGEAYAPGRAALISLWRLKPQFYGEKADADVFQLRVLKEAVHELGHTLGLGHCSKSYCVMHFSNSIFDTDRKQSFFCEQCYLQAAYAIAKLG